MLWIVGVPGQAQGEEEDGEGDVKSEEVVLED